MSTHVKIPHCWKSHVAAQSYKSKYVAILKNAVAVSGRVGMEECSLDSIF